MLWVILVLSVVTVANRIYYTYLALNDLPMPSQPGLKGALDARVLLDRRARDARLRPVGDRDPGVRVADAAGVDRRPDGDRPGPRPAGSLAVSWRRGVSPADCRQT